jgi:T-complex protein 1 subunit zeta
MARRGANVNPDAEIVSMGQCLQLNVAAARGLQSVLKSNLGPKGTLKMLVGGAGQIKITKDGSVLLYEMQIQHPTAMMIARAATAMDDQVGDGTTSTVLFTGELLKLAEQYTSEGLHPRLITEGYEAAKDMVLDFLDGCRVMHPNIFKDRELVSNVAQSSLRTKLSPDIATKVTEAVVSAMMCISEEDVPIDLHMIEIMSMEHKSGSESCFIDGLVMDHGARHPDMPKSMENVHILTCNVSMEYEKTEIASGFYYSSAEEREKMVNSERKFTDEKVMQLIEFKRKVCKEGESFAVLNQKGIDPVSLDMLAKEGIFAVRRAKRRNMERLTLAFGGVAVNSFDDLSEEMLGWAGSLHEEGLGEDKFTFVEHSKKASSCTILIRGPNKHTIDQIKDATRDGLRAVKAALEDKCLIPGAGAFEIAAYRMLMRRKHAVSGKAKLGVEAFAKAMLIVPKVLAENSGLDIQDAVIRVEEEQERSDSDGENKGYMIGMNLENGEPFFPGSEGVWDSYIVKRQSLHLATVLATQLLLVDEVMKAGKAMGGPPPQEDE